MPSCSCIEGALETHARLAGCDRHWELTRLQIIEQIGDAIEGSQVAITGQVVMTVAIGERRDLVSAQPWCNMSERIVKPEPDHI
jgi:hypothetical protein